jgi:hypothetical protein
MVLVDYPKEGIIFLLSFGMAHSSSLFDACKTTSQTRQIVAYHRSFVLAKPK